MMRNLGLFSGFPVSFLRAPFDQPEDVQMSLLISPLHFLLLYVEFVAPGNVKSKNVTQHCTHFLHLVLSLTVLEIIRPKGPTACS